MADEYILKPMLLDETYRSGNQALLNIYETTNQSLVEVIENITKAKESAEHIDHVAEQLVNVYNNVAEMKQSTRLKVGMAAKTLGYYSANDGGGAYYVIRAKQDSDVDDGGSIHELANGLVAELIVENGTVNVKQFGAKGDGETDDTQAIQKALDSIATTICFSKNTYIVSKNNSLVGYEKHDQPCLNIREMTNKKIIGNNATLWVKTHGQGILEVIDSNNIIIDSILFRGYGKFPAMSTINGRGEKSTKNEGWRDSNNYLEFGTFKNNSLDTSQWRGFDGDSSVIWGIFGNGYIGNAGTGLMVYGNSKNISINNCEAFGFNYFGFEIGTRTYKPQFSESIHFSNCYAHDCYAGGFSFELAKHSSARNCRIENVGHPDAFPKNDTNRYEYTYPDPGYGVTVTRAYYDGILYMCKDIIIDGCTVKNCIRKGLDIHSGEKVKFSNNTIENCYYAGVGIEGTASTKGYLLDTYVTKNNITNCGQCGCAIDCYGVDDGGSIGNVISKNILKDNSAVKTYGILHVHRSKNTNVSDNLIIGEAEPSVSNVSCIMIAYSPNCIVTNNNVDTSGFSSGIVLGSSSYSLVKNNIINTPNDKPYTINYSDGSIISNNIFIGSVNGTNSSRATLVENIENTSGSYLVQMGGTIYTALVASMTKATGITRVKGMSYINGIEGTSEGMKLKLTYCPQFSFASFDISREGGFGFKEVDRFETSQIVHDHEALTSYFNVIFYDKDKNTIPFDSVTEGKVRCFINLY